MAGQTYSTYTNRINKFPGRILAKAQFDEQLTKIGSVEPMPQNKSETIEWLRFYPYGGVDNQWIAAGGDANYVTEHTITEGVTPTADNITSTTVNTTLIQIGCLYSYTDKTRYLHEEGSEIPKEMEDQAAARIVLTREMQTYGAMKAVTTPFYGGTGTSKATVNGPPTLALFQRISRSIQGKHGGFMKKMLKAGMQYGSQSVDAGWCCYCHTDMEATFENMVGFTKVADYGGRETVDPNEIGSVGRVRVIVNPILTYEAAGGAVVGSAVAGHTPKSDAGVNIDIYPLIVIGQGKRGGDAFGQVALRGLQSIDAGHIPVGTKSAADPLGQRGYVSAKTWQASKILNEGWMAVAWVSTEALT